MTPSFVEPLAGKPSGRFELVHVESGAVLASRLEAALEAGARRRGLRGRAPLDADAVLIFAPSRVLHTLFAPAPVDALFVARDGTVLKVARAIKPWRASGVPGAYAVVVGAAGFAGKSGTVPGDRMAIREAQAPRPPREIPPVRAGGTFPAGAEVDVETWDLDELAPARAAAEDLQGGESGRGQGTVPAASGVGRPSGTRQPDAADVERILARRTPVAWFEAVAVVRELCDAVVASSTAAGFRVPALADIVLTQDGRVEVLGDGPPTSAPVAAVARVLLNLLAEAETLPVQLRLLALEEVSPAAQASSLPVFASRIEFFERPGRRDHVRAVVERFRALPPAPTELRAAQPLARPVAPPPLPWWRQRRFQVSAAAAAGVVCLAAIASLWPGSGAPGTIERRGPVARAVAGASQRVSAAASDGIDAISRWLGLAEAEPPAAAAVPAGAPAEPAGAGGGASGVARRARARIPQTAPEPVETEVVTDAATPVLVDSLVYSIDDAGIVAPRLDRSRLPAKPPAAASQREIPQVEVVISAAGEVESVRLVNEPAGVHAAMMLSAVKNWRFHPATRDGVPVRYRMRLRLTNQ